MKNGQNMKTFVMFVMKNGQTFLKAKIFSFYFVMFVMKNHQKNSFSASGCRRQESRLPEVQGDDWIHFEVKLSF